MMEIHHSQILNLLEDGRHLLSNNTRELHLIVEQALMKIIIKHLYARNNIHSTYDIYLY